MEAAMNEIRRSWTEEDSDKIRNLAGKVSLEEIARQLNRTEAATRVQAWKLGVSVKSAVDGAGVRRTVNKRQPNSVEQVVAPAAIERALSIYQQLQERDQSVVLQARKILTQHIYGMVDQGERNEQRLTVGGLIHLKAVERDHAIRSAHNTPPKKPSGVGSYRNAKA
jgi:IS30 family transposase